MPADHHLDVNPELARILAAEAVVARREHPELTGPIYHTSRTGELVKVLPGIFVASGTEDDWRVLAVAACKLNPDVVVTGRAALNLAIGTRVSVGNVEAFHGFMVTQGFVAWHRREVPAQWRSHVGPLQISSPAWTAVDLCGDGDAEPLDWALNAGIPLEDLWAAFRDMPHRPGNPIRRQLLQDSRDIPWSPAERLAHRVLREAGITGWRTNRSVAGHVVDIAFGAEKVALEIDGYRYHSDRQAFEKDRLRDQHLMSIGWVVMRITWAQLQDTPDQVVATLRRILRQRRS